MTFWRTVCHVKYNLSLHVVCKHKKQPESKTTTQSDVKLWLMWKKTERRKRRVSRLNWIGGRTVLCWEAEVLCSSRRQLRATVVFPFSVFRSSMDRLSPVTSHDLISNWSTEKTFKELNMCSSLSIFLLNDVRQVKTWPSLRKLICYHKW